MSTVEPSPTLDNSAEYTHIGAYFKSLREHYELDVQQVASRLHIRAKYIEALEAGDMNALPGKVYTQGYIVSYAEFLGLDAASVIAQYDGLEQTQSGEFRIANPTEQAGMPAWRFIAVGALIMLVLYWLIGWLSTPSVTPLENRIDPVPERILEQVENVLILTPYNEACLSPGYQSPLPCYYAGPPPPNPPFIREPVCSIMELR